MDNSKKELLKEFPTLERFANRLNTIAELLKDAEQETDLSFMADSFKTVLRLQERLYSEMTLCISNLHAEQFNGMAKNCREWKEIAEKLRETLKEEQQAYNDLHDQLCLCMVTNPRYTFEHVILKAVERKEKAENGDGWNNWQWRLHFPLIARFRMAWMLIFGRKEIETNA